MAVRSPAIRPLRDDEVGNTLTEQLVGTADCIRQLATDFGQREHRVFLVWVGYSADEDADGLVDADEMCVDDATIGAGRPSVIAELELLPTPRVGSMTGIGQDLDAVGLTERGGLTVDQISMSYSEDILLGLLPDLVDPDNPAQLRPGIQFFWEVRSHLPPRHENDDTAGGELPSPSRNARRKFVVSGVPERDSGGFQWIVPLVVADGARGSEGELDSLWGGEVLP